jgi:hypothetical protein
MKNYILRSSGNTGYWRKISIASAVLAMICLSPSIGYAADISCDVAIVGGGPGGVHTAYKLTNPPVGVSTGVAANKVCIFEKKDKLGGRIEDVQFGPNPGDVVGTGAYRMYSDQYTYKLAAELGMAVVAQPSFSNLRALENPNGHPGIYFGYSGSDFMSLYNQTINDDDMWSKMLCNSQVPRDKDNHPLYQQVNGIENLSSFGYVKNLFGNLSATYLYDNYRFRGDFDEPIDAAAYMEYTAADFAGGSVYYADPGFSFIINKMKDAIVAKGGKIFLEEPVGSISKNKGTQGGYTLVTNKDTVNAKYVIIATEHGAIAKMKGDIPANILRAKLDGTIANKSVPNEKLPYYNVQSTRALTVTNKWDKQWWKDDLRYPDVTKLAGKQLPGGKSILRADTTINLKSSIPCLNSIELPYTTHQDNLNVTRSVYVDNRVCVQAWADLYKTQGEQGVNAEVIKKLREMFPKIFDGSVNEPKITQTHVTEHVEAWYFIKEGALKNGYTNKNVFDWSANPLQGEKVYLVGDEWNNLASGWSNAAYTSSIKVLNAHFGMNLPTFDLPKYTCPKK